MPLDVAPGYSQPPPLPVTAASIVTDACSNGARHDVRLFAVVSRRGVKMVRARCARCDISTAYVKHVDVKQLFGVAVDDVPVDRTNACDWCEGEGCQMCCSVPCARCKRYVPTHQHHTAPRALFADADLWPLIDLCQPCHSYWHSVATPGVRHDPAPPAPHLSGEWYEVKAVRSRLYARRHGVLCSCHQCEGDRGVLDRFRQRHYGSFYTRALAEIEA